MTVTAVGRSECTELLWLRGQVADRLCEVYSSKSKMRADDFTMLFDEATLLPQILPRVISHPEPPLPQECRLSSLSSGAVLLRGGVCARSTSVSPTSIVDRNLSVLRMYEQRNSEKIGHCEMTAGKKLRALSEHAPRRCEVGADVCTDRRHSSAGCRWASASSWRATTAATPPCASICTARAAHQDGV